MQRANKIAIHKRKNELLVWLLFYETENHMVVYEWK